MLRKRFWMRPTSVGEPSQRSHLFSQRGYGLSDPQKAWDFNSLGEHSHLKRARIVHLSFDDVSFLHLFPDLVISLLFNPRSYSAKHVLIFFIAPPAPSVLRCRRVLAQELSLVTYVLAITVLAHHKCSRLSELSENLNSNCVELTLLFCSKLIVACVCVCACARS